MHSVSLSRRLLKWDWRSEHSCVIESTFITVVLTSDGVLVFPGEALDIYQIIDITSGSLDKGK